MRTHSGATDTPSSSHGCQRTSTPPAPTLSNAVASLINISADNAHILQAIAQNHAPTPHGHQDPPTNNTYADFPQNPSSNIP